MVSTLIDCIEDSGNQHESQQGGRPGDILPTLSLPIDSLAGCAGGQEEKAPKDQQGHAETAGGGEKALERLFGISIVT